MDRSHPANYPAGYIALLSALVLSFSLLVFSVLIGRSSWQALLGAFDRESHRQSLMWAESCANLALRNILDNFSYQLAAEEVTTLDDGACRIRSISYGTIDGDHRKKVTVVTQGQSRHAFSDLRVTALVRDPDFLAPEPRLTILRWAEIITDP